MTGTNISAVTGILFLLIYLFQPFHIIKELRKGERLQIPGTKEAVINDAQKRRAGEKKIQFLAASFWNRNEDGEKAAETAFHPSPERIDASRGIGIRQWTCQVKWATRIRDAIKGDAGRDSKKSLDRRWEDLSVFISVQWRQTNEIDGSLEKRGRRTIARHLLVQTKWMRCGRVRARRSREAVGETRERERESSLRQRWLPFDQLWTRMGYIVERGRQ